MPKNNVIQFSLPEWQREALEKMGRPGESLGLTAKRLVLLVLADLVDFPEPEPEPEPEPMEKKLRSMEEKLRSMEEKLKSLDNPPNPVAVLVPKKRGRYHA